MWFFFDLWEALVIKVHRYLGQGVIVEVDGWVQEADFLVDQDRTWRVGLQIELIHEKGPLLQVGLLVRLAVYDDILIVRLLRRQLGEDGPTLHLVDQRAAVRALLRRFLIPNHGRTVLVCTLEHAWTQRGAHLIRLIVRQKVAVLVCKTQIAILRQPQILLVMRQFELLQLLILDLEMPQIRMHQLLLYHLPLLGRLISSALCG